MSEIPDDIMKAADSASKDYMHNRGQSLRDVIAVAILSERERCAKLIEEGFSRRIESKTKTCAHRKFSWEDCDQCCANAIRASTQDENNGE